MTTKKQKTIIDSLKSYKEGRDIIATILKAMGEKWPNEVRLFEAQEGATFPPVGSLGAILLPPTSEGENGEN